MPTIADVARHAQVSPSTVSYVLSGKRSISEGTRERVQRSIRELGYHPHAGARALASNRTSVIALVLPLRSDMYVPVLMQFAVSVVTAARAHGHDVLLLTNDEGPEGLRRVTDGAQVDALIVMDVELDDPRVPVLDELGLPAVLIGVPADPGRLTCIDLDFYATGRCCAEHLAELGHRETVLIGHPGPVYQRGTGFAQRTIEGYREASLDRGLGSAVYPCGHSYDEVHAVLGRVFAEHPEVTGLIVHNEPAQGVLLDVLRRLGKRVPEDLSVVAICPEGTAETASTPLSAVPIPASAIGQRAVEAVMGKIVEARAEDGSTLLSPQLTVRASSAVARRD